MAPEMVKGEEYDSKVDVFSYAIVMYELLFETTNPYGKGFNSLVLFFFLSQLIFTFFFAFQLKIIPKFQSNTELRKIQLSDQKKFFFSCCFCFQFFYDFHTKILTAWDWYLDETWGNCNFWTSIFNNGKGMERKTKVIISFFFFLNDFLKNSHEFLQKIISERPDFGGLVSELSALYFELPWNFFFCWNDRTLCIFFHSK